MRLQTLHRRRGVCVLLLMALLPSTRCATAVEVDRYVFGVFPYFSPSRLEEIYAPAAADLAAQLGRRVDFRTSSTFEQFFANLKQGEYDLALIQPFYYVPASAEFGYVPLARMQEPFESWAVTAQNSGIETPEDLRGKILATPPAFVPVVHMMKSALRKAGLEPDRDVTLRAFKTVDACFQQVLVGAAAACVAPPFAVIAFQQKAKITLHKVLEGSTLPNLTLVAQRRVPQQDRERITAAFVGWSRSETGRAMLRGMNTQGFVPAQDSDYDGLRQFVKGLTDPWLPSVP